MATADTAIRVRLTTKRKDSALKAAREAAGPPFRLYQAWGLIEDAGEGVRAFAERLSNTGALWELARERPVSTTMLSLLIQVLSQAYQDHLLADPDARPIRENPRLPIPTAKIRQTIKALRAAAEVLREPLHPELVYMASPELADELETRAKLWGPLLTQLQSWEPPRRKRGRPVEPKSSVEESVCMILGGCMGGPEADRWAAEIAAEFLGEFGRATATDARHRRSAREAADRRRSKQRAGDNK
jgi:hypothetical protein